MTTTSTTKNISVQRRRKMAMLESFSKDCETSEGMFIAEYAGLDVASLSKLRIAAKEAGGRVRVVKNTVAKRVISETPKMADLADSLTGQILYASGDSAQSIAKLLRQFAKEDKTLVIKGGIVDGSLMNEAEIVQLAELPSRDEMYAIVASTLNAPITKFARTLKELPSSIARALSAVRDGKDNDTHQQISN